MVVFFLPEGAYFVMSGRFGRKTVGYTHLTYSDNIPHGTHTVYLLYNLYSY